MGKVDYEVVVNGDLNATKTVIDEMMKEMGFTLAYSSETEATAQRGSGLASMMAGPFAGKNNIAVKFGLVYAESDGKTTVGLSDEASGLGKTLTLTGGTTKKVLLDVYNTLKEGINRKGL